VFKNYLGHFASFFGTVFFTKDVNDNVVAITALHVASKQRIVRFNTQGQILPMNPLDLYLPCDVQKDVDCFSLVGLFISNDMLFLHQFNQKKSLLAYDKILILGLHLKIYSININFLKVPKIDIDAAIILNAKQILRTFVDDLSSIPKLCNQPFDESKVSNLYILGYPKLSKTELLADGSIVTRDEIQKKGLLMYEGLYVARGKTPIPVHTSITCENNNINYYSSVFSANSGSPVFDLEAGCIIGSHYSSPQHGIGGYAKAIPLNYQNLSIYF